jgi:hypothetical protein
MLKKFIPFILLLFLSIPYFAEAQLLSEDQSTYYISTNGVRVRSAPEENAPVLGLLDLNDEVRIHNTPSFSLSLSLSLSLSNDKYVEIQIIKTDSPIISSEKYFIFKEFLLVNPVDYKEFTGKYFIVLNVASEHFDSMKETALIKTV